MSLLKLLVIPQIVQPCYHIVTKEFLNFVLLNVLSNVLKVALKQDNALAQMFLNVTSQIARHQDSALVLVRHHQNNALVQLPLNVLDKDVHRQDNALAHKHHSPTSITLPQREIINSHLQTAATSTVQITTCTLVIETMLTTKAIIMTTIKPLNILVAMLALLILDVAIISIENS